MLSAFARLAVIASILVLLGTVAIVMGFSKKWPDAQLSGAVFFVGGWLLAGLVAVAAKLEEIREALSEKHESRPEADDQ